MDKIKKEKEQRIRSIKSHVRYDDYFGTLATVISLGSRPAKDAMIASNYANKSQNFKI